MLGEREPKASCDLGELNFLGLKVSGFWVGSGGQEGFRSFDVYGLGSLGLYFVMGNGKGIGSRSKNPACTVRGSRHPVPTVGAPGCFYKVQGRDSGGFCGYYNFWDFGSEVLYGFAQQFKGPRAQVAVR